MSVCGVDEAGRGPVMGPMVVAGVLVQEDSKLREMRVRDSKKVSPQRREWLAQEIRKVSRHEVIVVPAEEIDVMRDEMTLNTMEVKLFATVIERLRPRVAYVDSADVDEEGFKRAIQRELSFPLDIVSKHGADDLYPVVSAASILAKTRRDEEMRRIERELGETIGSGYPSDPTTIEFMRRWLREKGTAPPHTRLSWDTTRRLLSEISTRRIDEFGKEGG